MRIKYDLHIHSALSPCAEKNMTPANIVGFAKLQGLDMIAVSDHNSVLNVQAAQRAGEHFGVTVVPAAEVQTAEDIHMLCLFEKLPDAKNFMEKLCFFRIKNRPDIFGEQQIVDENDTVTGTVCDLLLTSAEQNSLEVKALAEQFGGFAVPAHVDREENGMAKILGAVPEDYAAVELSHHAPKDEIGFYAERFKLLVDSDAHDLNQIGSGGGEIDLPACTAGALLAWLRGK
jgi:hypothetical protein